MAEKVVRGKIISSDGKVLAQTLTENGSEIRDYPYGRMFAHVVGYNDKGKSGLESVCNFDLLKSDANLMTQITSSLKGEKSIGDNVYTTLNTKVQDKRFPRPPTSWLDSFHRKAPEQTLRHRSIRES